MNEKGKSLHPVAETVEMILSKSLKPVLSNKIYTGDAKSVMQKYNLDSSMEYSDSLIDFISDVFIFSGNLTKKKHPND